MSYQPCIKCDGHTGRCREDQINIGNYGPLCEDCRDELVSPLEEGSMCPDPNCGGTMEIQKNRNCSCHIHPPCHGCVTAPLECSECYFEVAK